MRLYSLLFVLFLTACGSNGNAPDTITKSEPVQIASAEQEELLTASGSSSPDPRKKPKNGGPKSKPRAFVYPGAPERSYTEMPATGAGSSSRERYRESHDRTAMASPGTAAPAAGPRAGPASITKQLFNASMAFNVKDKANIEETIRVQLLINPYKTVEDLKKELTVKGTTTTASVKVSKIIIASLTAANFKITKITSEEQALNETGTTEWLWKLEPTEVGNHEIEVTITAVVKVDGDSTSYHIRTYDQTIQVEITPKQLIGGWFKAHWEWLFSTLLIPLGIWIYTTRFRKKKSKPVESVS